MSIRLKDTIYDLVNKSDWNNLINKPTFATIATSGKYSDLSDTPTFYTLTFSSGTFSSGSFVANSANKTINIPTTTSHISEGTNLYFTNARAQSAITGGASTIASSNLTASRALISDSSGKVAVSAVTSTELGYLDGVTSAIQTQLNAKLASSSYTASDVLTKLKTVDGSDSGLDADLLDGKHNGEVTAAFVKTHSVTTDIDEPSKLSGLGVYRNVSGSTVGTCGTYDTILTVGEPGRIFQFKGTKDDSSSFMYRTASGNTGLGSWKTVAFTDSNVSSANKLNTARKISISGAITGNASFDGSADITISTSVNHTHSYAGSSSAGGVATSAAKLATSRTIWGQSFDGTGNIDGILTINAAPQSLCINHTSVTTWNDFIKCINPKLTTTNHTGHITFGYDYSSKNLGYVGFRFAGNASDSNMVTLGLHSVDNILNITAAGNVGIGTMAPTQKLHVDGTIQTNHILFTGTIGASTGTYLVGNGSDGLYLAANESGKKLYLESTNQTAPYFRNSAGDHTIYHSGNLTNVVRMGSYNEFTTGISLGDISKSGTYKWNDIRYASLKLVNWNNCISFIIGGTNNNRQAIIQAGHASESYSEHLSTLYLNKFGGEVYIGTNVALHSGNWGSYISTGGGSSFNGSWDGTLMINGSNSRGSYPSVKWHISNVNWAQFIMNGSGELELRGGASQDAGYATLRTGWCCCTGLQINGESITFTT